MNWDQVEGKWKEFQGRAQTQWGKLTNDDLDVIKGRRTELEGLLQKRYGYAKEKIKTDVDSWLSRLE
ncbi:CsbD family protein [Tabrizicola sp.]|uniref:CsbD family protein n=1 Tax=Tabrizicola sp. TaxID=2005166 RepID=UPI002869F451|nr:CsbD family protein [Tabrizicola sp.]